MVIKVLSSPSPWKGHYDLVSGLIGLGVYGRSRNDRAANRSITELVVSRLLETAEEQDEHVFWRTQQKYLGYERNGKVYPMGACNLGLAHGNAGATLFFAEVYKAGNTSVESTLLKSANWLLSCRYSHSPGLKSSFGYLAEESIPSRLAWCYGDLGAALALVKAGNALGNVALTSAGIEVAILAASRDVTASLVSDDFLCHGSLGVSLMFHRIFAECREPALETASIYWLDKGIENVKSILDKLLIPTSKVSLGALDGLTSLGICLLDLCHSEVNDRWCDWLLI